MTTSPRLMIVSQGFPPLVGGSQILLANLLRSYQGGVVAAAGYSHYQREDPSFLAPCPTAYLRAPRVRMLELVYDRVIRRIHPIVRMFIRHHVRRWRPSVIMGVFPVVDFFVPAFQVAKELNIPFYAYMHDLWQENYGTKHYRGVLAAKWEEHILRHSRRILCMTESQLDHYHQKYGIVGELLPHTVSEDALKRAPHHLVAATLPKRTVLFVGAVSEAMNSDALRVLALASELLPTDVELVFCTGASASELSHVGIQSSRLRVMWVPPDTILKVQSSAHVLVAPLSHKNCAADEVRTVFSTKLLEYMISGRPIVVFAPKDSFHAWSARRGNWGYVVDEDDAGALAKAIMKVMDDGALAGELVADALSEARRRDAEIHAARLLEWVVQDSKPYQ
jgi:glycosyltransferase involved in cell wall biosynthesis